MISVESSQGCFLEFNRWVLSLRESELWHGSKSLLTMQGSPRIRDQVTSYWRSWLQWSISFCLCSAAGVCRWDGRLSKGQEVSQSSAIAKVAPFLGPDGLMRVKFYLLFSGLSFEEKHRTILSKGHAALVLNRLHHLLLKHAGVPSLVSAVHWHYSIVGLRHLAKQVKRKMCCMSEVRCCSLLPAEGPLATGQSNQGSSCQCIRFRSRGTFVLHWPPRKEFLCAAVHIRCSKGYSFGVSGLTQCYGHCVGFEEVCCSPWVTCIYLLQQCKDFCCFLSSVDKCVW